VPVLGRHGDRFLGHLCESVLHSVDLGDWIAADDDDYVAKAVAFAQERQALAALRGRLRERVLRSSLCKPDRFARTLEAQFERMWRTRSGAV
jgi:predicted O-linked N-acetylglucosamine transferase (SPINDLY family)